MSAQHITPGMFGVPPPRIGEPSEDNRERLIASMRHRVRRQQRRSARVNMRAQRGLDLTRATDTERHPTARAAPEITAPVQTRVGSAPVGEPAHHNARRAVAQRNAAEREPLARHERARETMEIGRAGRIRHIRKLSGNYQQIIIEIASTTSYTARNNHYKGREQ
jgi:hypothetical protein